LDTLRDLDGNSFNVPVAPAALRGSMRPIPDVAVKAGAFGPDVERAAQLTYQGEAGVSVSVIIAQGKADPPNFWRAVNDTAEAFRYDPATNMVRILLRGSGDPPGQWKITSPNSELKGTFLVHGGAR
jgi:hypothetical protein